jgi:CDK-activating kinase assembly factor MAT1
MVKKEKLSKKSLDSIEVDKDVRIRRKIKSIFNRMQEDFATLEEFNNYEEEVEDCIFNLVHDVNVETTRSKILQYQKDNEERIVLNQGKAFEEDSKMERRVQQERELLELTYQDRIVKERQERSFKAERSRQMNEIALGERDKLTVTKSGGDAMEVDAAAGASAEEQARMQQQAMAHFSSHSALLRILENRPAPKVISPVVKTEQQSIGSMSKADKLLMYAAGGYSHKEWFKKSWATGFPDEALPPGWA